MRTVAFALALATLSAACAPPRIDPVFSRRFAQRTFVTNDTARRAHITAFSLAIPRSDPNTVLNLAPEAQAAFVQAVAQRAESPKLLASGVATPIRADGGTPGERNLARFARRVVFSVEKRDRGPANRLEQVRITIRPRRSHFVSWDRVVTRYNTVDLGTLSFKQGAQVGAELGLSLPVFAATPKVSSSASSELQESVALRQRLVDLNGALTRNQAILLQQSAAGLDLTGNVVVDFVVQMPAEMEFRHQEWFHGFAGRIENPKEDCQKNPGIRGEFNQIASSDTADSAFVELEYTLRRVDRGDATITESDDHVTYVQARDTLTMELIPQGALHVPSWVIRPPGDNDDFLKLRARGGGMGLGGAPTAVQFVSYDDAERALVWLRRCEGRIPGFDVQIGDRPTNGTGLRIQRMRANSEGPMSKFAPNAIDDS